MKHKLTIIMSCLLLAVGWTNTAQAQLKNVAPTREIAKRLSAAASNVTRPVVKEELKWVDNKPPMLPNRAPRRENGTITANVTHVKSWYDAITYDWVDANGTPHNDVSITEPATDPYQMAYLLGNIYKNPDIPGIQYTAAGAQNVSYENIELGWDLPGNARWNDDPTYDNIVISYSTNNYIRIYSIKVMSGDDVITSYCYATDGSTLPSGDGWAWSISGSWRTSGNYFYPYASGATITIPGSMLAGYNDVKLVINCYDSSYRYYADISVNGTSTDVGESDPTDYTWTYSPNNAASSITPPTENGYTVLLVKVKNGSTSEPRYTSTWDEVINYFDTHIDEVQLLTDGTRLNENSDDAGTMFSYSGELNRFYFISKGKTYAFPGTYSEDSDGEPYIDGAPTYCMYEEFSGHQPVGGTDIKDFYSKLLYGNSYNVIHDCQGVNLLEHYFSMTGKTGTESRSLTNLVFWIPDHRSVYNTRVYDEEYLPHVGLYTITLEADAEPVEYNYEEGNRNYKVNLNWVSSLNSILDFPVEQDYEVWEYVYNEEGKPVAKRLVGTTHDTTYTFERVEQYPDSYTIIYRVKGWPTAATNTPGHYPNDPEKGSFFALSNLPSVLIPGYNNFLSLDVAHYESDYVINEERNYYRNFLTVDNQNPDDALTAHRIINGEANYELNRFDVAKPTELTKAADLQFKVEDNKVRYKINYLGQNYIDDADQSGNSQTLTGYKNLDDLGYPIEGVIATLSGGSGSDNPDPVTYNDITITTSNGYTGILSITVSGDGQVLESWTTSSSQPALPSTWQTSKDAQFNVSTYGYSMYFSRGGTITIPHSLIDGHSNVQVTVVGRMDSNNYDGTITVNGVQNATTLTATSTSNTWNIAPASGAGETTEYTRTWNFELPSHASDWILIDADGDGYNWEYNNNTGFSAYSGSGCMSSASFINDVGAVTPNNWMISPEVNLGGSLTLWACGQDENYPEEKFGVYVYQGTYSGNGTSGFVQVGADVTTTEEWKQYTFDLSAYSGKGRIAIVHHNCSDKFWLKIDDVSITYNQDDEGFTLLNDFIDYTTYQQEGIVVFELPWKSIQVKLQDTSAGSAGGYFVIQNGGKLRFIMPAGYNNANLKFVIHNASVNSDYYDGTFTLTSSTGETRTITIPDENNFLLGNRDYEAIFTGISSGDVITINGTHTENGTLYNYSPDFSSIRVYVQGGHDGISENEPLNLAAINFVDQFYAETDKDQHAKRYGYVLKAVGADKESAKPEVPVQHTSSNAFGFYSLNQIQNDTKAPLLQMNVMNADINMTLSRDSEIYYYTLDRKANSPDVQSTSWEELSKLQRREDDSYKEMYDKLSLYKDQTCNPPVDPNTSWVVDRYDNNVMTGAYNSSMSYVPIIWTHGDQDNRRVKWNTEERHNSYGAPIWKTGVAQVVLQNVVAERQEDASTKWTYGGENCSLYMLDKIEAVAKLPIVNNVTYVPYMFRIFVRSNNHKLRGYRRVADGEDPNMPSSHFVGDAIDDDALQCVWSGYVNDLNNDAYGVTIDNPDPNTYVFHKNKVDRTNPNGGAWDKDKVYNAIFAGLENIVTGTKPNYTINPEDLTVVVRFYYLVEGFNTAAPGQQRNGFGNDDPAGYGAEGSGEPGGWTGVSNLLFNKTIESVTYVNPQGMQSDKPFSGVNIVITRYSDGSATTAKVVR